MFGKFQRLFAEFYHVRIAGIFRRETVYQKELQHTRVGFRVLLLFSCFTAYDRAVFVFDFLGIFFLVFVPDSDAESVVE